MPSAVKTAPSSSYDSPLLIHKLLSQMLYRNNPNEIVYGGKRETWSRLDDRARRLAFALSITLGVPRGTKVAVIDYDTSDYLEAYYGVPYAQAVLHTVNIRLPPEQIVYTMSHAEDRVVIIRDEFLPLYAKIKPSIKSLEKIIVVSDSGSVPKDSPSGSYFYEDLLNSSDPRFEPGDFDENTPATLFYTSGTTGLPKGVSFTHRQLVLHSLSALTMLSCSESPLRLEQRDVVLPLVPLFHVHGWGFPYISGLLGMKVVFVGKYEPGKILENISKEKATFSYMVPTILNMLLNHPSVEDYRHALSRWKALVGGSAISFEVARKARSFGIRVMSGYGLSETAPILTIANPAEVDFDLSEQEMLEKVLLKTGLPIPLVELRVVDSDMNDVRRDGKTIGEIVVRAPWTTKEYLKDEDMTKELWEGGWLHTRDLATLEPTGYVTIVDRSKDAVKSGGEWISTIVLEDLLMSHPAVLEAAVIGVKSTRWDERPIAIVTKKSNVSQAELREHLAKSVEQGRIPKFWIPDEFVILSEALPRTSTGKLDKKPLREKFSKSIPDPA